MRVTPIADPDADPGAAVTRDPNVVLELAVPPFYNGMMISEDVTFSDPLLGDTVFAAVQDSLSWTLSAGEGQHELFLQFRAPTCRTSPLFSASMVVDTTDPVASPPTLAAGGTCTNEALVALSLAADDPCTTDACGGIYQMRLADDG
ncbi:hypothetical protein ACFL6C_12235, partial [Myxococcota bacterium]